MIAPAHLHGLWLLGILGYIIGVSVLVTAGLAFLWYRADLDRLDRWSRHRLVVGASFGVVVTLAYWGWVLANGAGVVTVDPVRVALHVVGSIAGIAGAAVLRGLRAASAR